MAQLPLEGVRILDFTVVWAGPFGTLLLGDMGAELIRIDNIHRPDANTRGEPIVPAAILAGAVGRTYPDRVAGNRPWDRSVNFNLTGRHKKSATFALQDPRGRELLLRLVAKSDVIICNNTTGTLDKLGLGYPVVSAVNPQIIMIQLPGAGNSGPYRDYKLYGACTDALSGHAFLRGYPDADLSQTYPGVNHADAAAGATAAFIVLVALHYRMATGKGQYIDMSQIENVTHHLSQAVMDYSMNQRIQGPRGNRDPSRVQGVYRCRGEDNWLAISTEDDAQWQALCQVIGRPELASDPRFADVVSRYQNHDAVDETLAAWAKDQDHRQVFHLLQQAGIPAGPVSSCPEVLVDPHLQARGFFEAVTCPRTGPIVDGKETPGTHLYPGPLFDMSKIPLRIRQPAPTLGEHNEYVYKEILGLSDQECQELLDLKLIGDTYLVAMPTL